MHTFMFEYVIFVLGILYSLNQRPVKHSCQIEVTINNLV
ncbi:hypothetical protein ACVIW0_002728 [Bradyrhizobium sp. USDA 4454]